MILRLIARLERFIFRLALRDGYPQTDRLLFAIAGWLGRVGDWIRGGPETPVVIAEEEADPLFVDLCKLGLLKEDVEVLNRINASGSLASEQGGVFN